MAKRSPGCLSGTGSNSRPADQSSLVEQAVINWDRDGLGSSQLSASGEGSKDWLDDFLNHKGQTGQQRNPNTGLRVVPTGTGMAAS